MDATVEVSTEKLDIAESSKEKKDQRSFRLLAISFGVTVSVLILIFILLWMLVPRLSSASANLCTSEVCISVSALLQKNVNLSANPCQDFCSFACGGTLRRSYNPKTINHGLGLIMDEVIKLDGKLFELFLYPNLARSEDNDMNKLYQVTREIFMSCISWHDPKIWWLPSSWKTNASDFSLSDLTRPLISQINAAMDLEDFLATLVKIQGSGLLKPLLDGYFWDARSNGSILSFEAMDFQWIKNWNDTEIVNDIIELYGQLGLKFSDSVYNLVEIQEELSTHEKNVSDVFVGTISELEQNTKELLTTGASFSWTKFIQRIQNGPLNPKMKIVVDQVEWFCNFLDILSQEQMARNGSHYDLIILDYIMSIRNFLPIDEFKALRDSYSKQKFLIDKNEDSREFTSNCVKMAETAMPPVALEMFKNAYVADDFALVDQVISQIEEAMEQNIDGEKWIQSNSRDAIRDKIRKMKQVIGHTKLPKSEIKSLYKHQLQPLNGIKNFGDAILVYKDATFRGMMWSMTAEVPLYSARSMFYTALEVNAYYYSKSNSIHIILGILGTQLYNKDYPNYLLYGGIGSVIGHEISHAFDPNKEVSSIFDPTTLIQYNKRVKCLVDSYSELMLVPNVTVNGNKTVGDNFADIVGINAAFRAYKNVQAKSQKAAQLLPGPLSSALSPDQLFFVKAAQFYCKKLENFKTQQFFLHAKHSPHRVRLFGTMSQSKEFANVFGCKPGDKMYLKDAEKCQFW